MCNLVPAGLLASLWCAHAHKPLGLHSLWNEIAMQNECNFINCMLDLNSSSLHCLISKHNNQIKQRLAVDQTLGSVLYQQPRKLVRMYNSVHTLHFNILLSDNAVFENTSLPKVANLARGSIISMSHIAVMHTQYSYHLMN